MKFIQNVALIMMSINLNTRRFGAIGDWFLLLFPISGAVAIALSGLAAGLTFQTFAGGFRVLLLTFLLAGASGVCGWVMGLLFGVPRTLSRPGSAPAASEGRNQQKAPTSRVNTNLEDISDWLTKTIVGVGLTQLYSAPKAIWRTAILLDEKGMNWPPYGPLLCLATFFYFFPGGFWLGYVTTRTILTMLFSQTEDIDPSTVAMSTDGAQLRVDRTTGRILAATANVAEADRSLLKMPLQAMNTEEQLAGWAAAKARSNDLETAATIFKQIIERDPQNIDVKEQLAKVQIALGQKDDASKTLSVAPLSEVNVLRALYESPPNGFNRAISLGNQLLARADMDTKASLHVYMACAYGQAHAFALKTSSSDNADTKALADKAIAQVTRAMKIDPTVKGWLRSLWKPLSEGDGGDNDLATIPADDPVMVGLLGP